MKAIMMTFFCLLLISFTSHAVRLMDDEYGGAYEAKVSASQVDWDTILFQKLIVQKVNYGIVAANLKAANNDLPAALETQFKKHIQVFPVEVQKSLEDGWRREDWINFSTRAEHYLDANPVGDSQVFGLNTFQINLDRHLESSPLFVKLVKMIALTHVIGPQLTLLHQEGVAFYQQTYKTHKAVSEISAYWSLMLWLDANQVHKSLQSEVRRSNLQLSDMRRVLSFMSQVIKATPDVEFNKYIRVHHSIVFYKESLKEYIENWWRQAELESPISTKKQNSVLKDAVLNNDVAKIIIFPKKLKISCEGLFGN